MKRVLSPGFHKLQLLSMPTLKCERIALPYKQNEVLWHSLYTPSQGVTNAWDPLQTNAECQADNFKVNVAVVEIKFCSGGNQKQRIAREV